jgi:hypothetical protein
MQSSGTFVVHDKWYLKNTYCAKKYNIFNIKSIQKISAYLLFRKVNGFVTADVRRRTGTVIGTKWGVSDKEIIKCRIGPGK